MLDVIVKFVANELTPGLDDGNYQIPEGTSVRDLIAFCGEQCGSIIPDENYERMYPIFNGKPVRLTSNLTEDGILHLCRVVMGG